MPIKSTYYPALISQRKSELAKALAPLFEQPRSFVCEIGSGHGHFLTAYALANPDQLCIGLDIIADRVERARRKRDRAELTQLHFVHAEARLFLETLPAHASISRVFILFPDPWPKTRHHRNRIIQPAFLTQLRTKANAGARLYFRTDHQPYFAAALAVLDNHPDWKIVEAPWEFEHETVFQHRADSYHSVVAEARA